MFSIILHVIGDIVFGISLLQISGVRQINLLRITQAFVIGMLFETSLGFVASMLGFKPLTAFLIISVFGVAGLLYMIYIKKSKLQINSIGHHLKFTLGEIILLLFIFIKIVTVFLSWIRFPLYFDDAMTHWSGRGKALYGEINWSLDPESINFMGGQFGYDEYPLLSVIWRANGAWLNGGWSELISRADSFMFFLVLIYSVYHLTKFLTKQRWMALAASLLTCALPLQFAHAASGYSEIILQALGIMFLIALIKKEYMVAGLITSTAIFAKNEGLVLYLPLFFILVLWNIVASNKNTGSLFRNLLKFLLASGVLILPWIIFKLVNDVPLTTPTQAEYYYHDGSLGLFFEAMFQSSSSSIYWSLIFILSAINIMRIIKDQNLKMILVLLLGLIIAYILIFCFTGANIFLVNQATIHRSLLQIAPIGIVLMTAGFSGVFENNSNELPHGKQRGIK